MNRKIKHSKIKNTAILFEVLARKVTSDILEGKDNTVSLKILKTNFNKKTELRKELDLYRTLLKNKFKSEVRASNFVDLIVDARKMLNTKKLRTEKYNIIKEIKNNFVIDNLFSIKFDNYAEMASIYKLFEYSIILNETANPEDLIKSKFNIVDFMLKEKSNKIEHRGLIEMFREESKDVKILTNKILIDKFNEKYSGKLNENQKKLIKEYINNISDSNSLNRFISDNIPKINKEITLVSKNISNDAIIIKLNEVKTQLNKLITNKKITDKNIVSLMKTYELIDELKKHKCKKQTGVI